MTEITVAATSPFAVEVMVYEEDTWLLMSAANVARETRVSSAELQGHMQEQARQLPGEILKKGNRWYAIVNDIDDESFDKEQIVTTALSKLFKDIVDQGITRFGIQSFRQCPDFAETIRQLAPDSVAQIWIQERS